MVPEPAREAPLQITAREAQQHMAALGFADGQFAEY